MVAIGFAGRLQREVSEDFGEEKIGAVIAIEEVGVAPEPSEACARGPFAFEDWAGIDVEADGRSWGVMLKRCGDGASFGEHGVVVVEADGVGGDASAQFGTPIDGGRARRSVRKGEANDGLQARVEKMRVETAAGVASEPCHLIGLAFGEPAVEKSRAMV